MVKQKAQLFLWCAIFGAVIPLWPFVLWLAEHGVDPARFIDDLTVNQISIFAWVDVVISAVVVLLALRLPVFDLSARQQAGVVLATCCVGVSCGLPLMLYYWQSSPARTSEA